MRTIAQRIIAIAVGVAVGFGSTVGLASAEPVEDTPRFSCAVHGNRICGPGAPGKAPAGFYNRQGQMVKAWTNYDDPSRDPLSNAWPAPEALYGSTPLPADQVPAWQPNRRHKWAPGEREAAQQELYDVAKRNGWLKPGV